MNGEAFAAEDGEASEGEPSNAGNGHGEAGGGPLEAPDAFAPVPGDYRPPDDEPAREVSVVTHAAAIEPRHGEIEPAPQFKRRDTEEEAPTEAVEPQPAPEPEVDDPNRPKRSGWWQRRNFFGRSSE
jgi:ribonuclease E